MGESKSHSDPEMKGWLLKWTNYLKGYQRRWFVLSNGTLSYYRNQAEMSHTCRGTISLQGALIHTEDSCMFVISNGATHTFHIKASSEVERQKWVTALELAKAKAIRAIESEEEEEDFEGGASKCELSSVMKELTNRLEYIQTCNDLINKHGNILQRSLTELESIDSATEVSAKIKTINERATLFRISSNAMINACSEYLTLAQTQGRKWQKALLYERSQKLRLEEMVEQLATQHSFLEQAAKDHRLPKNAISSAPSDDEEGAEFYECEELVASSESSKLPLNISCSNREFVKASHRPDDASGSSSEAEEDPPTDTEASSTMQSNSDVNFSQPRSPSSTNLPPSEPVTACTFPFKSDSQSNDSKDIDQQDDESSSQGDKPSHSIPNSNQVTHCKQESGSKRVRRTAVPNKPYYPLNLWSIMKNCIGKELSKIPMPVNFSEPLSMLQRLTEDYEYSYILDHAATLKDDLEQLAYVAAFTVSSYSTTSNRTGKPFNPLLGETYECDRMDDLGWRALSEQVSHHPPMVAQHCEGRKWKCWQEFTMASKFRGKYLQVVPLGIAHLEFDSGNHYTWRKVTTTVHNIIVGKLWVDQHGDMDIINSKTGHVCHLHYVAYSYFNRDVQRKVTGRVLDEKDVVHWIIRGTWDSKIEIAPVTNVEGVSPGSVEQKKGPFKLAWERNEPLPDSDKFYNFTLLACQLNEMEPGVAPTDSRNRPDQRYMEEGQWDKANQIKIKLEEKQRAARRKREATAEEASAEGRPYQQYEPIWFKRETDPQSGNITHVFTGEYWKCKSAGDWSMCPNIF
ncbi:oxysterol-binding protein 1 isoform X2 [Cimex lectularius]|uniref:PH domain-containing protein n=1 Tax=Cimex lectularius TaxID=79782 RepID=A0A8I6SDD4_CIMLE|nr:oxysterol-binding protein 1 isoform X2 [Cimex lectularius]